jgi:hypothetical protein
MRVWPVAVIVLAWSAVVQAAGPVEVKDAWVRAPVAGQKVVGAYLNAVSNGNFMLVGVSSPLAGNVEVHETTVENGVMRMRPVTRVALPAGKPVRFEPGGLHLMLVDLKQLLKPGEKVPLALTVQRPDFSRVVFTIHAEVRTAPPGDAGHRH